MDIMEEPQKIQKKNIMDNRGWTCKLAKQNLIRELDIDFSIEEIFYSYSYKNVVRGMHYQIPPYGQRKVLNVIKGRILDVLIDIRPDSSDFGKIYEYEIELQSDFGLYIPKGFAHGFKAEEESILLYALEGGQQKEKECGIRWDSFGYDWKTFCPILSDKDMVLPSMEETMQIVRGNKV